MAKSSQPQNPSAVRVILGSIVFYLIFLIIELMIYGTYSYMLANSADDAAPAWIIVAILSLLLILNMYGFLGFWLLEYGDPSGSGGSRSSILRLLGNEFVPQGQYLRVA